MADKNEEIILKGRLKGWQRMRLTKLLDMMYKPSEIAEIIEFERRQFYRVYIPEGCPHQKDGKGYLWINGKGFREWYEATYPRVTLGKDETFCLTCKKPVKLVNATRKQKGRLHYWVSSCPNCGRKLTRIITRDKLEK